LAAKNKTYVKGSCEILFLFSFCTAVYDLNSSGNDNLIALFINVSTSFKRVLIMNTISLKG
jgi:hypothetical protein